MQADKHGKGEESEPDRMGNTSNQTWDPTKRELAKGISELEPTKESKQSNKADEHMVKS